MSKFLYPIFKLPNENDEEKEPVSTWIKWWLLNNYKKSHSWVLSEIITGNPLTLNDSVQAKFPIPPLPGGNSEQVQYSGKNKFNKDGTNFNGKTGVNNFNAKKVVRDAALGNNGYELINYNSRCIAYFKGSIGSTYNISFNNNYVITGLREINSEEKIVTSSVSNIITLTEENLAIMIKKNDGTDFTDTDILNLKNSLQIVEGSTATAYEPYVGGTASPNPSYPQEITNVTGDVEVLVQNKNLFDYENYTYDKTIFTDYRYIEIKNLKPNTAYTIYNYESLSGSEFINVFLSSSPSYSGISFANLVGASYRTYTTNATGKVYLCTYSTSWTEEVWNTFINYFKNAMFVEGTDRTTTYTPHKEQTYTFPLGTQRMFLGDYLADDGIHHVSKQIELDGSNDEEWQRNGTTQGYSVLADNVGGTANTSVIPKILCNKLIAVKQSAIYGGTANNGISSQSDTQRIYVRINETITTVELLKQWLAENPITVEYELATEEITPYTTEQQQAYDEIKQAFSYEEQTNISGSSDESNPLFEVQYYMKEGE